MRLQLTGSAPLNKAWGPYLRLQHPHSAFWGIDFCPAPTRPHFLWHCACDYCEWCAEDHIPGFVEMKLLIRARDGREGDDSEILRPVSEVSLQRSLMCTLQGINSKLCLPSVKLPYLNKLIILTFPIKQMPLMATYILLERDFPSAILSVAVGKCSSNRL